MISAWLLMSTWSLIRITKSAAFLHTYIQQCNLDFWCPMVCHSSLDLTAWWCSFLRRLDLSICFSIMKELSTEASFPCKQADTRHMFLMTWPSLWLDQGWYTSTCYLHLSCHTIVDVCDHYWLRVYSIQIVSWVHNITSQTPACFTTSELVHAVVLLLSASAAQDLATTWSPSFHCTLTALWTACTSRTHAQAMPRLNATGIRRL